MTIRIPHDRLSPDALYGLIEQFISRDGPDSGHVETDFEKKVCQVRSQLDSGKAAIFFDPSSKTCNIVPTDGPDGTNLKQMFPNPI